MKTTKPGRKSPRRRDSAAHARRVGGTRARRDGSARNRIPGQPLEEAWTLPAEWYVSDAHHAREMAAIFGRTWQHIGPASRLAEPGSYVSSDVAGERLIAVRGQDARVRAFHNVCRHRAGSVVLGDGCSPALRCTYHGWTYGLDGKLLSCPEMETTRAFDRKDFGLSPVPLASWGQFLFVNLDPAAAKTAPLSRLVRPLEPSAERFHLDEVVFARRDSYEIACNWKVYVDNFLEGYHIPRAHPGLFKVLDYRRYTVEPAGAAVVQTAPPRFAGDGSTDKQSRPGKQVPRFAGDQSTDKQGRPGKQVPRVAGEQLGGEPRPGLLAGSASPTPPGKKTRAQIADNGERSSVYLWLFPGFMVNISTDYVQTNIILPAGAEKTVTIFDYYLHPGGNRARAGAALAKSIAWSDEIQQEDIRICENVQRNLRSLSYEAGRYCARRENGLHHFHELVRRALSA